MNTFAARSLVFCTLLLFACDNGSVVRTGGDGGDGEDGAAAADLGLSDRGRSDTVCAAVKQSAELVYEPVDIILLIDTSSTMQAAVASVEQNINTSFASIIEGSGLDYRVIVIATHRAKTNNPGICVSAPLSGTNCNPVPAQPVLGPRFFHYDRGLGSSSSLSEPLAAYRQADKHGFAPQGWSQWLRPVARKVFLAINDGTSTSLLKAAEFDSQLLALDPQNFGSAQERRYVFHAILGLAENNPPTKPWEASDSIVKGTCSGYSGPLGEGVIYQDLTRLTGGVRFPLCQFGAFDVIFKLLAQQIVEGQAVACSYEIPEPPPGKALDKSTIVMKYKSTGKADVGLQQVADEGACSGDAFYIDGDLLRLCPATCSKVQAAAAASLEVLFGCNNILQ